MLQGSRYGKHISFEMTYQEVLKYAAQFEIGFQLFTPVKTENSKKSTNTRATANPQRVPKWIISDLEREVRDESWRYPCVAQTKSAQWRREFSETLGKEARSSQQWLMLFQDCAAWSEGQNREKTLARDREVLAEHGFLHEYKLA